MASGVDVVMTTNEEEVTHAHCSKPRPPTQGVGRSHDREVVWMNGRPGKEGGAEKAKSGPAKVRISFVDAGALPTK